MRKLNVIHAEIQVHQQKIKQLEEERDQALRNITVVNPGSVSPSNEPILGI